MSIVKRISKRIHKEWAPKSKSGQLSYYHEFQDVDMTQWRVVCFGKNSSHVK